MRPDFTTVDFRKTRRDVWHTSQFQTHTSQFQCKGDECHSYLHRQKKKFKINIREIRIPFVSTKNKS